MPFRTIQARFPGTCKRCGQPIAVGQRMRYGGRGNTWHFAADCVTSQHAAREIIDAASASEKTDVANDDPGYLEGGNYNHVSFCPPDSDDDCPF